MSNKFQNEDFKSESELTSAGGTKAQLLNTTKIYSPKTTNVLESDLRKNNDAAIGAPTTTNDNTQGYEIGSRWVDTVGQKAYICISNSTGAAVWKAGSEGGIGGVDILKSQTAEESTLADFTQTGLEIVDAPIILHGKKSFRLIHQAASTRSFKEIIPVDTKFRGKVMTFELDNVSSALMANLTILFRDETNSADIGTSQQIQTDSQSITATVTSASNQMTGLSLSDFNKLKLGMLITGPGVQTGTRINGLASGTLTATLSQNASSTSTSSKSISSLTTKRRFSFLIPENCLSLSYTISALQEANLPETYIDDIIVYITQYANTTAAFTVPKNNNFSGVIQPTISIASLGTQPTKGVIVTDRIVYGRLENRLLADYQYEQSSGGSNGTGDFLFTLPGGLSFDSSVVFFQTGTALSTPLPKSIVGYGKVADASNPNPGVQLVAYDATRFRAITATNSAANFMSVAAFGLSGAIGFGFHLDAPIAGWLTNETETKQFPLTSSVLVTDPDSYLQLTGGAISGGGTVSYTTIGKNVGNAFSANPSTGVVTVLKKGIYNIAFSMDRTAGLTGALISAGGIIVAADYGQDVNESYSASASAALEIGDQIFVSNPSSGTGANGRLSITHQASMKIVNPSTDQKVEIPTHELRFEGASSRGSTDTAIVKFDTVTKIKGDGFEVLNTTANGTVVTIKKAGLLTVQTSLDNSGSFAISVNQQSLTGYPSFTESIANSEGTPGKDSIANTVLVKIGDKIRVSCNVGIASNNLNLLTLVLQEQSVAIALQNVQPNWSQSDSSIRVNNANGSGSTNTNIARFTNIVENLGSAATYFQSATLGDYWIINEEGNFTLTFAASFNVPNNFGISKNCSALGTAINNIPATERLALATTPLANYPETASWSGYLQKGDVIRAHSDSAAAGTVPQAWQFTISKVGKPNLTSVDVTPFVNTKTTDTEAIEAFTATGTFGSINTGVPVLNITKNTNLGVIRVDNNAANGTSFVALKDCTFNMSVSSSNGAGFNTWITRNSTTLTVGGATNLVSAETGAGGTNITLSTELKLVAGDVIRVQVQQAQTIDRVSILAVADNNATASPTQQVSSDTIPFVFKSTPIVDSDPVGTFNTYRYAVSSNTPVIGTTAPTQTIANMNINGVKVFTRAFNAASTDAFPARVDIKIGKGLSNVNTNCYYDDGKLTPLVTDLTISTSNTEQLGALISYEATTGILSIDLGLCYYSAITSRFLFDRKNNATRSAGLFTFTASSSPSLVTIPNLTQRIAYLSDVKSSGTSGGSSISGTQTRTLNTIVDNTGIVTSLVANQFTLPAGTYSIDAFALARSSEQHKIRIRNITDGVTSLIGSSEYIQSTANVQTKSNLSGEIMITSTKVFELQHFITTALATTGLGVAVASGESEVYAQVKITKVK